ncbi:MAG: hypothetical protein COB36_00265 [Alphaproteobacteria bacterium]|nr:MAG: hypothetical protein COB36_00265 [Alphaproteobacteria bacterium]
MQKDIMKITLTRNIMRLCATILIALLPHSVTAANTSEALVKDEKHNDVKSMLLIAAQNGDIKAQTLFIQRNTQANTQAQKPVIDQAKTWADNGNVSLMVWLADNYYTGNQLQKKYISAARWYIKAARKGDISAQYNLASMYIHGQGIKKNLISARDWLTLAANKDHKPSIDLLEKVNAEITELKAQWEAIKEEQRQAQLAFDKHKEQLRKAQLDVEKAKQAVKSAKKAGLAEWVKKEIGFCYSGKSKSCFDLAVANETGKITGKPEYEIAEKFYIKACDMNSYKACMNLANNYASKKFKSRSEDGTEDGFQKSFDLYKKSCAGDIEPACSYYGSLNLRFANGQKEAAWAYDKSCNLGAIESCLKVGKIYYAGKGDIDRQSGGITKDLARAKKYFISACKGGIKKACKLKIEVSKQDLELKKSALEASQKELRLLKEKQAIAEISLKEAILVKSLLASNNKFREGTAFKLIKDAPLRTDKIKITEYFSYNCKGCYLLQKNGNLEKWINAQKENIEINKIHITGMSKVLARLFYTLKKMKVGKSVHKDLFNQIDLKQPIHTKENDFLDFISRHDIDKGAFNEIYSSPEMDKKIKGKVESEKNLSFKTIPAFVVNDQYYITLGTALATKPNIPDDISKDERNRQIELRVFEIIDYLVGIEREVIKNK